jgi:uncharacterized protein
MNSKEYWIKELGLEKHPEGGYYKEVYRSELNLVKDIPDFKGVRSSSTSIYFLLDSAEYSAWHRIKSDEIWYFHDGSPLNIHMIDPEGNHFLEVLGKEISKGEKLQVVVPAGYVFASENFEANSYSLVGCMVSPGFDFNDFELFNENDIKRMYPDSYKDKMTLAKRL